MTAGDGTLRSRRWRRRNPAHDDNRRIECAGIPSVAALRYDASAASLLAPAGELDHPTVWPLDTGRDAQHKCPRCVGAQNVDGSAAIHLDGDIYSVFAIRSAIADSDLVATMNELAL